MTVDQARSLLAESRRQGDEDDSAQASDTARRAVDAARTAGDPLLLGLTLTNLAIRLGADRSAEQAVAAARESADIFRRLLAQDPEAGPAEAAEAFGVLSNLLDTEAPDEALAVMQEALALRRRLYRRDESLPAGINLLWALGTMDDRLMDVDRPDLQAAIDDERSRVMRAMAGAGARAGDDQVLVMLAGLAGTLMRSGSAAQGADLAEWVVEYAEEVQEEGQELPAATRAELAALSLARAQLQGKLDPTSGSFMIRTAVRGYRQLEQEYPGRYRADVAAALQAQAALLAAAGHRVRAWQVGREARKLAGG